MDSVQVDFRHLSSQALFALFLFSDYSGAIHSVDVFNDLLIFKLSSPVRPRTYYCHVRYSDYYRLCVSYFRSVAQ